MQAVQEEHDVDEARAEVTNIPGWAPSVSLEVSDNGETGEEEEIELYSQRSKLSRFRDNEWKESGHGDAKLLQRREGGKVRFIMRQEKTMKLIANHYVIDLAPYCDLKPNAGSTKCWVWRASDHAGGKLAVEQFALKFKTAELAAVFEKEFNRAKELNSSAFPDWPAQGEDVMASKDADGAAQASDSAQSVGMFFFGDAGSSPATGGSLFSVAANSGSESLLGTKTGTSGSLGTSPGIGTVLGTASSSGSSNMTGSSLFGASSGTGNSLFSGSSGNGSTIFGGSSSGSKGPTATVGTGGTLFGGGSAGGSLFGGKFGNTCGSLFGGTSGSSLFGESSGSSGSSSSNSASTTGSSIFGGSSGSTGSSLFGVSSSSTSATGSSLLGGNFGNTCGSLFGGISGSSLFGESSSSSSNSASTTGSSIFGGISGSASTTGSSLFGVSSSSTSVIGSSLFGGCSSSSGGGFQGGGCFGTLGGSGGGLFGASVTPTVPAAGARLATSTIFGGTAKTATVAATSGQLVFGKTGTMATPLFGASGPAPCQQPGMSQNFSDQLFGEPNFGTAPARLVAAAHETGPSLPSSSETHGKTLDAAILKAIEDAVAAGYSRMQGGRVPDHSGHGSCSGQGDARALESLREEIRRYQEQLRISEEKARKAEERTQQLEEELGGSKQQDESNLPQMLKKLEQQMESLRQDFESLRRQHSDDRLLMANLQSELHQQKHERCSLEARLEARVSETSTEFNRE